MTKFVKVTRTGSLCDTPYRYEDLVVSATSIETVKAIAPIDKLPEWRARAQIFLKNKERDSYIVTETVEEIYTQLGEAT